MIMKKIIYIATIGITLLTTSCDDFLDRQVPQGIVTGDQIASPEYVDNLVISACINVSPVPTQPCNHSIRWMKRPIR